MPRRLVSEVVLLLALGIVIGPYGLELAAMDAPIDLLRELGLAFLFLLAGFEVELRELTGRAGGAAALTWLGCLLLALGVVALLGVTEVLDAEIAVAIALTSTALGTLLPILKDHRLLKSPIGVRVLRHGAYGELGPVVAIAVLLGTRGPFASLVVLAAFLLAGSRPRAAVPASAAARPRPCVDGSTPERRRRGRPRSAWWCCSWRR